MNDQLRILVDLRDRTLQKSRIAFANRIDAASRGADQLDAEGQATLERWHTRFSELEREADEDIRTLCRDIEIIQVMTHVKGVGALLAAKCVSMIDIRKADTVSALWRYAGYAAINGQRERPTRGEVLHYNIRLKTTCYLIGTSLLRTASPYRRLYDNAKEYYTNTKPDWTKAHCHAAAMRKMIKIWLSHLWVTWRALEGLDIRPPYAHEKLGHTHEMKPEEFGWPHAE